MELSRRAVVAGVAVAAMLPGAVIAQDTKITIADSPLPNALDVYYSFLVDLAKQNKFQAPERMMIGNTITSFDISLDTPFYNEGLFRSFADRNYLSSPDAIGPVNSADRFSTIYETVIVGAADAIDQRHPEIRKKLDELRDAIKARNDQLDATINQIEGSWAKVATQQGLKPGDPSYDMRHIAYLEQAHYATRVDADSKEIAALLLRRDQVRRAVYTAPERALLNAATHLERSYQIARPRRPTFERTVKNVDENMLADPRNWNSSLEVAPDMLPLGDLNNFLSASGSRALTISKSSTATEHHDNSWGGNAGGSFSFFGIGIGGGGGGGGSDSFTQTVQSAESLSIDFANIAEVLVDRGEWFNSTLFDDPDLHKLFEKVPGLTSLKNASVSLIIGRGLTLTLATSSQVDTNTWSEQNIAAHGGVSFMGISFGASGGGTKHNSTVSVTTDGKGITFKDDPALARVLAVRVAPINRVDFSQAAALVGSQTKIFGAAPGARTNLRGRSIDVRSKRYQDFLAGKITYLQLVNP